MIKTKKITLPITNQSITMVLKPYIEFNTHTKKKIVAEKNEDKEKHCTN